MPTQLIANGNPIVVRHDWGHKMDAELGSIPSNGTYAMIRFGMAGERKVKLTPTPSNNPKPGRFYGSGMELWFIDAATIEQLIATAKADDEEDDDNE